MGNKAAPKGARILLIDIETAPIIGSVWKLFDENLGLSQIKTDWHLLSFSAKWLGEKEVFYYDQSKAKDIENDKPLLDKLWKFMDEADIIVGQNSKRFDVRKIQARMVIHGMTPPSPFRQLDTMEMAKRSFGFTSYKLEYMSDKLCTKYKKLTQRKFNGFELCKECLAGNKAAWAEMKRYNILDTLSLEELFEKLRPWGTGINLSVYTDDEDHKCGSCQSDKLQRRGFAYSPTGKFQRYQCTACGSWSASRTNLLSKEKRSTIHKKP